MLKRFQLLDSYNVLQQGEKTQLAQVSIGNTESQNCSSSGPDQQPIPLTPFLYPERSLLLFLSVPNLVMWLE